MTTRSGKAYRPGAPTNALWTGFYNQGAEWEDNLEEGEIRDNPVDATTRGAATTTNLTDIPHLIPIDRSDSELQINMPSSRPQPPPTSHIENSPIQRDNSSSVPTHHRQHQPPASNTAMSPVVLINDTAFTLKMFTGSVACNEKAEEWLSSFDRYTNLKRISNNDKLELFKLLLSDDAALWLRSLPADRQNSIDAIRDAFRKRYELNRVDLYKRELDLWERKQGPSESVDSYIAHMRAAAAKINVADTALINTAIRGLRPEIRTYVLRTEPNTLEEVLQQAKLQEAALSTDSSQSQLDSLA